MNKMSKRIGILKMRHDILSNDSRTIDNYNNKINIYTSSRSTPLRVMQSPHSPLPATLYSARPIPVSRATLLLPLTITSPLPSSLLHLNTHKLNNTTALPSITMSQYAFPGTNKPYRSSPAGPSLKPRPSRWYVPLLSMHP